VTELRDRLTAALADRYRLERELGAGGMATVYLAEDLRHHRRVALKVLRPDLAAALGPQRFLREIETTARLAHPNILPLLDSGEAGGTLYYVMPYVQGESLRESLAREKQLQLDDVVRIAREVADALSYAHSRGVVHRDIKPENILLESGHAIVADFGIARAVDQAAGGRLTETGVALGTPAYMSPEQAAGSRDLDSRSDVYSLACVVYEMLAGQPPFTGPTAESVVYQHLAAMPPHIAGIRPAVPESVAAALQRALGKTPADRFRTVALFAEALGAQVSATATPVAVAAATPAAVAAATLARFGRSWRRAAVLAVAALAVLVGAVALGSRLLPGRAGARHPRTAIAVLPLENLSPQGPYAYFAGGLHDELLTQLAKVAALRVIGRTSVAAYAGSAKRLREIGDELGVGSIVEGSVQVAGNRLRVIVQLIDPVTEAHLWAEHYDRTLEDAFAVQSDIARRIVEEVGATLTSAEAGAIAAAPTQNAAAYQLYLQGLEYYRRPGIYRRNLEIAQQLYERALALDSTFALAHAALSSVHLAMYGPGNDRTPARLDRARREAAVALRLAPDLPQAHLAAGQVRFIADDDSRGALDEFELGLRGAPNDADLWGWIGYAHLGLGNWDSAVVAREHAVRLDPRNANRFHVLGDTYHYLHRFPEAIAAYRRESALAPDVVQARLSMAWSYIMWKGDLDTLRSVLGGSPQDAEPGMGGAPVESNRVLLLLMERRPDSVIAIVRRFGLEADPGVQLRLIAPAHLLRGDTAAARAAYVAAAAGFVSQERAHPDDPDVHGALGIALAALGRRADALREARWLAQSETYRVHPDVAATRAEILARVGETDAALADLERALVGPSRVTAPMLRLSPNWDPILADPRFQALLAKYADPVAGARAGREGGRP
jgi:TolB-like protein/tRNA A-37 threonylcarbamoyl transferase component Bud32/Flp pilus assembly protein TadD